MKSLTGGNLGSSSGVTQLSRYKEFSQEDKNTTLELLKAYRTQPSARVRAQLVRLNIGLVKKEVGYWSNQSAESYEDLLQVGSIGLLGAIDRFEVDRGYAFSSFATRYIRGEIQHYLRDKSSTLRMPRRWQELYEQAGRVGRQLRTELNREPSDREIINILGVTMSEWQEIRLAHYNRSPMSLDAPIGNSEENSISLADIVSDPRSSSQGYRDDAIRLEQAFNHLEQRTREIMEFVFVEDLTQREVAKMLGVSAVTISRQVKKGLSTLKDVMLQAA